MRWSDGAEVKKHLQPHSYLRVLSARAAAGVRCPGVYHQQLMSCPVSQPLLHCF